MKEKRFFLLGWGKSIFVLLISLAFTANVFAADEIKVGIFGPLKVNAGQSIMKGAQLAAEEINNAGGVNVKGKNYKIVLRIVDDNSMASVPDAVSAMERLATVDRVGFVIGGFFGEPVLTQMEVTADNKVILLCTAAINEEVAMKVAQDYKRYKYWFRVTSIQAKDLARTYIAALGPMVAAIRSELGIQKPKVALVMDEANWTKPAVILCKQIIPEMGCELAGIWKTAINATSLSAELSAVKSSGAHIIIQALAGPVGNIFSRQWGEMQIPAAVIGVNIEAQLQSHWQTTDGKCNYMGALDLFGSAIKSAKTKPFLDAFQKKFNDTPLYTGVASYDALHILKAAIERAGSLNNDLIVPQLEKTDYIGPQGRVQFYQYGHVTPHATVWGPNNVSWVGMQWRDGKRITFWPDGQEVHPALLAAGVPKGWDKTKYQGTEKFVLPPWMVTYWKEKNK